MSNTMQEKRTAEAEEARADFLDFYGLRDGATVYAVVRSVSASGMSRTMSFFVGSVDRDGRPAVSNVTWQVAKLLGYRLQDSRYGERVIRVNGTGMDMVFAVVYDLSNALFGNGYALRHGVL